jgi:SOS response regulatory protein OraA/RecX
MPTVTGLRARPRGRVAVELDGGVWRTLPAEPVVRAGLRVGCELDRTTARRLRRELRRVEALAVATGSLRVRDLSSQALAERLRRANVAPELRKEAVSALERVGVVDDLRFATSRASALAARGYGDAAILADLERQGVPGELHADALAPLDPETDRAREVVRRRGGGAKTARFLASKGFGEEAREAALGADFANGP